MENRRHSRTASKNLESFRFICHFEPINSIITTLECSIQFKIGIEWREYINIPNILITSAFTINYVFEEPLEIKLSFHQNGKTLDETSTSLLNLLLHSEHNLSLFIGNLHIKVEEIKDTHSAVTLRISAKIPSRFWFWKPHYSIRMLREITSENYLEIYHSENSPGENCKWKKFNMPYDVLGQSFIKLEVVNTLNELIGDTKISIEELLSPGSEFIVRKPDGSAKGTLSIEWSELELKKNFVDYLKSGLKIKVLLAIDYTSSNLPFNMPTSNHHIKEGVQNPYEASITSVLKVLDVYNKDKVIHLYGFGGIPKGKNQISHCFKIGTARNYHESINVYRESLPGIKLSKPTNLNEIISKAQKHCEGDNDRQSYYVTLIITDGDIHDFPLTSTKIINSCRFPLSFIIIGIGNANFRNMEKLDSDGVPLIDRDGRTAPRDIVQFVPYNMYSQHLGLLASKVLEELPDQICSYMINKAT